jgi:hypothetical protein
MLSPRHCVVGATSVAVFVCARRGRALLQSYFHTRFSGGGLKLIFVAAATVPMLVGLNLADLHHPKISFLQPTLLPSAAGVAPVGGYLGFLVSVKVQHGLLDHNQAVWTAARDTRYQPDADGTVPFIWTPMESYLKFSIRLQNQIPRRYSLEQVLLMPPEIYCESRTLMRSQFTWPAETENFFLAKYKLASVSPVKWHGITMLRCQTNAPDAGDFFGGALWALGQSFGPDEFRLEPVAALKKIPADWAGKKITLASRGELRVKSSLAKTGRMICDGTFGCWHLLEFPLAQADALIAPLASEQQILVAVSALPAWMSLQKK